MAYSWSYTFPSRGSLIQSDTYWNQISTAARFIVDRHCNNCTSNNGNNYSVQTGHNGSVSRACSNRSNNTSNNTNNGSVTTYCGNRSNYANNGNCPNNGNNTGVYRSPYSCRSVKCGGDGYMLSLTMIEQWRKRQNYEGV